MDFRLYDRAKEGTPERTVQFLYDAAREHLTRKKLADTKDALLKPHATKVAVAPKGKGKGKDKGADGQAPRAKQVCWAFQKGECTRGDACRFEHTKGPDGKPPARPAAQPAAPEHAPNQGAKGKVPMDCGNLRKEGGCRYADRCMFRHYSEPPTQGDIRAIKMGAPKVKKVGICEASEHAMDEWALDTGAGVDVANAAVQGKLTTSAMPLPIWSAGGIVKSDLSVSTEVAPLKETVRATVLANTPNALAIGRRCAEQGFGFFWHPYAPHPELYLPGGERVPDVRADENYVPFIRNSRCRDKRAPPRVLPAAEVPEPIPVDDADPSPILGGSPPGLSEADRVEHQKLLEDVRRVIEVNERTEHDVIADDIADASGFKASTVSAADQEQEYRMAVPSATSVEHRSMHLPRVKGCDICDDAKHLHRYHLRRKEPMVWVTGKDAQDAPFGALVHMDWIEIRRGSKAAASAARALVITDDLTGFIGVFPSHTKEADAVVEMIHRYDNVPPEIRRWWTDRAAEFLAAAMAVRRLRPLAHFTSIPWRHAPKAEHSNRVATEGGRAGLIQAGLPESWWPLAITFWTSMFNGFMVGKDGFTPYWRRHGAAAPYRQFPFGALVLFHPHKPVKQARDAEVLHDKLQPKLVPAVLFEITLGPAGRWASSYGVIPLATFTSKNRPAKASLRRTCDVVFPDVVSFPLKQRLALHGAVVDKTLPDPAVKEEESSWEVMEDKSGPEAFDIAVDGAWAENEAKFEAIAPLGHILALEPDGSHDDEIAIEDHPDELAEVDADLVAAESLAQQVQPEIAIVEGGRAPAGWRMDRFTNGERVRVVSTPPWSRRPPTIEPEVWVGVGRAAQKELRRRWQEADPEGFQKQEDRRAVWLRARRAGAVPAAVAVPEWSDHHTVEAPLCMIARETARRRTLTVSIVSSAIMSIRSLRTQARPMIISGDYNALRIILGSTEEEALAGAVSQGVLAVRMPNLDDLSTREVRSSVHALVRLSLFSELAVHLVVTAGGGTSADEVVRVDSWAPLCNHVIRNGGDVTIKVAAAAPRELTDKVDQMFDRNRAPGFQKMKDQQWEVTTSCRTTAPRTMAQEPPRLLPCVAPPQVPGHVVHQPASMPLWCCLITRVVAPKSPEAQSPGAVKAVKDEVASHMERGTWDMSRVRELRDWMNDPHYTEVMVGRVFVTLGLKDAETEQARWRARGVSGQ